MTLSILAKKKSIRDDMKRKRDQSSPATLQDYSDKICYRLWKWIEKCEAKVFHSFLPMGTEVNIFPVLEKALENGLTLVVPKTLKGRKMQHLMLTDLKNLEEGIFGTQHPANATEYTGKYDLILVPGLAFSPNGSRIGYGAGYYDTFLSAHILTPKIGICYPFQILNEIPAEAHDVNLDRVIC